MVAKIEDIYAEFQINDRVKHPTFGEGTIMQRHGTGDNTKIMVAFVSEGQKLLLAKYAKLKKIKPIEDKEDKVSEPAPAPKTDEKPKAVADEEGSTIGPDETPDAEAFVGDVFVEEDDDDDLEDEDEDEEEDS